MNSLTLRKASPDDSEFSYCATRAAFREYVEKVWGWDEDEQRQLHEQRFGAKDFQVINPAGTDVGIMAGVTASRIICSTVGFGERYRFIRP